MRRVAAHSISQAPRDKKREKSYIIEPVLVSLTFIKRS